ncbi:unnamed protein product [Adineta steineri]|uniref:Uncharacterized protein n=1 Tax=Adineta steineri TaxID=433720 RepID=A0A815WNV3_9BILA|nr:unnamed protein product [Adineta steineri]CAF1545838.1 unnamed protein product [Adineta steineri]
MVNYPLESEKRERSFTFPHHSKLVNHCHKMLRSISNRSSNRANKNFDTTMNDSSSYCFSRRLTIPIYQKQQSIKKTFSLILNNAHFEICTHSDDHEMHEFIQFTSSEENLSTNPRLESNISDNTTVNQQSLSMSTDHPKPKNRHRVHRGLEHIINKIKSPRHEHIDESEKYHGYLVVETLNSELIVQPYDNLDQQATQHAEPCVQTNDDNFDLNQIQYASVTPVLPNPSPLQRPILGLSRLHNHDQSNNQLELQSTRSSVECGVPQSDSFNNHETQMAQELTASLSSTNSSYDKYDNINRSLLSDVEYVEAQKLDLEKLTVVEIELAQDHRVLQLELNVELEFDDQYKQALEINSRLHDELKRLQQEYDHIYLPWSCVLCTSDNKPYNETRLDTCETCESPSPLKDEKQSFWNDNNANRTSIEDVPQLEYDEHHITLIADREIDDYGLDYELSNPSIDDTSKNQGILKGNITPDGIIDDDFESELGGHQTILHDTEDPDYNLIKKIGEYGIVDLCGDDKFGRKVILCSACRLPHENRIQNSEFKTIDKFYDCLLKYIIRTFDEYVDMDYVIVYFHHGLHSYNRPSYGWLMKSYRNIERKYKKNLKALYVVHPTAWIKFLWPFLRSIISVKFSSKLRYINRIGQLTEYVHLNNLKIPEEIRSIDPLIPIEIPSSEQKPTQKFNVSLQFILEHEQGEKIPLVIRQTVDYIKSFGLNEPGIFRQTVPIPLIKQIEDKYNDGQPIILQQYGDVHFASCILKIFLRSLTDPLMTYHLYPELLGLSGTLKRHNQIDIIRDLIIEKLPAQNYIVLKYLIEFLNLVSIYSDTNLMTTTNLSLVFGPILAWSDDAHMNTLVNITLINTFTEILIARYTELFLK